MIPAVTIGTVRVGMTSRSGIMSGVYRRYTVAAGARAPHVTAASRRHSPHDLRELWYRDRRQGARVFPVRTGDGRRGPQAGPAAVAAPRRAGARRVPDPGRRGAVARPRRHGRGPAGG